MTTKKALCEIVLAAEAARIAGVSVDTIRLWHRTGKLPAEQTTNGTRLFKRVDVERLTTLRLKR